MGLATGRTGRYLLLRVQWPSSDLPDVGTSGYGVHARFPKGRWGCGAGQIFDERFAAQSGDAEEASSDNVECASCCD
jgi:hypothetical protein